MPGPSAALLAAPWPCATATRLLCKAGRCTLPGAAQRRLGVEWGFERDRYCTCCLGKTVREEATLGNKRLETHTSSHTRELLGVPLRLLCCRIWGGLCVGKSRGCAHGRRDWLLSDIIGEISRTASQSSCSKALAVLSSPPGRLNTSLCAQE